VQSKHRLVHILHLDGLIERSDDQTQPVQLIRVDPVLLQGIKVTPPRVRFAG